MDIIQVIFTCHMLWGGFPGSAHVDIYKHSPDLYTAYVPCPDYRTVEEHEEDYHYREHHRDDNRVDFFNNDWMDNDFLNDFGG